MTQPNYSIDPGLIALADQHIAQISDDLDRCIDSYRIHRGQTEGTVAWIVLLDNMSENLTHEHACAALALAVQRLAEANPEAMP